MLIVTVSSASNNADLQYLEYDEARLDMKVLNAVSAITGNNGTAGQLSITDNVVKVVATHQQKGLSHSYFGQIITQILD